MGKLLQSQRIADFAIKARFEDLDSDTVLQLQIHLLDSLGSLIHSLDKPTIHKLVRQLKYFDNTGPCKAPLFASLPVDRAAQLYTALIRYPDFMDNFLGKHATCHPSDNLGSLLAVCQLENVSGRDFLLSMAIAYQLQCRLIEEIPIMSKGFDHTALLTSAVVAAGRLQRYNRDEIANAVAMAGVTYNPLITTRAAPTYEWKGLISSFVNMGLINILLLAKEGVTGPVQLFEGPQGYAQIHGLTLDYNWEKENFGLIRKCILKSYNAEVHTQSSIEAVLELREKNQLEAADIEKIDVVTFLTAYHIVGGGEYGDRHEVHTKEQADHSLPYLIAVAVLDGQVMPEQFTPERINRPDVQELLKKVHVSTSFPLSSPRKVVEHVDPYTIAYPDKLMTKVKISVKNGKNLEMKKEDYRGFFTRPLGWDEVVKKFRLITEEIISDNQQNRIIECVRALTTTDVSPLISAVCVK